VSTAPKLQVVYVAGLATVQDLGRRGYRALGVPVSGALDRLSAAYANALVGNRTGYAVLEVFGSVRLRLTVDAVVAVTGGYPRVVVEGVEVAPWTPIYCRAGSEVSVVPTGRGFVHYVAISGGVLCEEVMGSASTYVRGGFGCLGRALKPGDELGARPVSADEVWDRVRRVKPPEEVVARSADPGDPAVLRVTEGIHSHLLGDLSTLLTSEYTVTPESDRMGYRLDGPPLVAASKLGRLPSTPTDRGYVQVPPDGKPIVLMADAQTTGGYAVALHVVQPDTDILAQLRPGRRVRFKLVSLDEAEGATSRYLAELENPTLRVVEEEYWT
jgi:biotin-dependent carboxylase-like uncharacterized protein